MMSPGPCDGRWPWDARRTKDTCGTIELSTKRCQVPVPGRHFGSGTCTTLPRALGDVDAAGSSAGVGEGAVFAGAVVFDRVGAMSSVPTEISTVSPTTATWTW